MTPLLTTTPISPQMRPRSGCITPCIACSLSTACPNRLPGKTCPMGRNSSALPQRPPGSGWGGGRDPPSARRGDRPALPPRCDGLRALPGVAPQRPAPSQIQGQRQHQSVNKFSSSKGPFPPLRASFSVRIQHAFNTKSSFSLLHINFTLFEYALILVKKLPNTVDRQKEKARFVSKTSFPRFPKMVEISGIEPLTS